MRKKFFSWLLYRCLGWKTEVTVDHPAKYIICLAPHTSNWEFPLGQLYAFANGWKINFLMKKEWFFWPLGGLFRSLGGIAVNRSKTQSLTDFLAEEAVRSEVFHLCITPEGTRSRATGWKKGFYYIAQKANIPILLYGIDYKRKLIKCTEQIIPTGNINQDLAILNGYYNEFVAKHPENFALDESL